MSDKHLTFTQSMSLKQKIEHYSKTAYEFEKENRELRRANLELEEALAAARKRNQQLSQQNQMTMA